MSYLLSDLKITDDILEYVTDLINVYFNIESKELPNLTVGIRRYLPTNDRSVLSDMISEDVSKFMDLMNSQNIGLTLVSITSLSDKFEIKFRYGSNNINLIVE